MLKISLYTITVPSLQEDELRESDNPNYAHLKEDLHVLVEVVAPPDQARARLAAGVAEVKKMLVPPVS